MAKKPPKKPTIEIVDSMGAPTKYHPKFCQMLIDHMASGLSFESFGAVTNTCEKTLYNWEAAHPDFLQAKGVGLTKCRSFWESLGVAGSSGHLPGFNSSAWKFNLQNRFKWTDRQDVTSGDKPTNPAQVIITLPSNGMEQKK